jgi:microcystin-dependent protein
LNQTRIKKIKFFFMADEPYISEIKLFAFNFPPRGWAPCNGQILPIASNQALFSLLGTTYGGNGQTTFGLPNLQGRVPIHFGNYFGGGNYSLGQVGGQENVTLITPQIPVHTHFVQASNTAAADTYPTTTNLWAKGSSHSGFATTANNTMNPAAIGNSGGSQPHNNQSPYLVVNFCIAIQGIFPSRN